MSRAWWILGGGYTGSALARELTVRSDLASEITITRREATQARALGEALDVLGVRVNLGDPVPPAIPKGAIVVCTAPPGRDPAGEIAALLTATSKAARIVYLSSIGVYGPGYGAWIDEGWPIAPVTASGHARAQAEAALAVARVPWVALRAASIYGPGRGLVDRIRAGTYRVVGDDSSYVSRIHVEDMVAAILRAAIVDITGAINAGDDDPAPISVVADTIAGWLDLPPPRRVPMSAVSREIADTSTANRRISNRRLRAELGVVLRYPSWRDGAVAELTRPAP